MILLLLLLSHVVAVLLFSSSLFVCDVFFSQLDKLPVMALFQAPVEAEDEEELLELLEERDPVMFGGFGDGLHNTPQEQLIQYIETKRSGYSCIADPASSPLTPHTYLSRGDDGGQASGHVS